MVEYYIRLFQSSKLHRSHKLLLTLLQLLKQFTTIFSPVSLPFLILLQLTVLSFLVYPLTKDQSIEHRTGTTHFMSTFSKENKTFTCAYQERLYYRLCLGKKQPPNFCCKIQSKCIFYELYVPKTSWKEILLSILTKRPREEEAASRKRGLQYHIFIHALVLKAPAQE